MHFSTDTETRFVGPSSRDIAGCVASTTKYEKRQSEFLDKCYAGSMGFDADIEAAKPVATKRVGAALENDGSGTISVYARSHNVLEEPDIF